MTIKLKQGDLLGESVDAIVNTVNCVGVMGKGIALQFKRKWPENFKAYSAACKAKEVHTGKMFIFDCGGLLKPHYIINFPTKNHWKERTKIEYIDEGLQDLVREIRRLDIRSIAIPPLGCGNGGLSWAVVRPRIERALAQLDDVDVLVFEPKGAPNARAMVVNSTKPKMTPGRAAIIKVLSIYKEMDYTLQNIEIQKLAYFLEEAGRELSLAFVKHNYGPYSDKIRHVLNAMDQHYISGVGDQTTDGEIQLLPNAVPEANRYLAESGDDKLEQQIDQVARLIEGFETPYGMELLATVHWVATHEHAACLSDAVDAIRDWNARKRAVLQEPHIKVAWNRLRELGWIPETIPQ